MTSQQIEADVREGERAYSVYRGDEYLMSVVASDQYDARMTVARLKGYPLMWLRIGKLHPSAAS